MSGGPRAAITGIADSSLGNSTRSPVQTAVDVSLAAIADAGVERREIDGLISMGVLAAENGRDVHRHHIRLSEQLGLGPMRYAGTSKLGSAATGETLREAAALIEAGRLRHVLVVGTDSLRTGLGRDNAQGAWMDFHDQELEGPYGHTAPSQWAMAAQRYAHKFGLDPERLDEGLAMVAVAAREWAILNPASVYNEPLTREEVIGSTMVSDPLRIAHCSRSIDGGSAFLVSAVESGSNDHPKPPIWVAGTGTRVHHYYLADATDLTDTVFELASASINEAMEEAGVGLDDIDVVFPYDGFAIMPLLILEAAGFAPRGKAIELYETGAPAPGGALPCNTHGGSLNHGLPAFPAVLFLLTEAVRQLRGEAGERQVPGARNALVHAWSGMGGVDASFVLGTEAA